MLKKIFLAVVGLMFLASLAFGEGQPELCQEFPGRLLNPQKVVLPDGQFIVQMAKGQTPAGGVACLGWNPKDSNALRFFVDEEEVGDGFTTINYFDPQIVTSHSVIGYNRWETEDEAGSDIVLYRSVAGQPVFQLIAEGCYIVAAQSDGDKFYVAGTRDGLATLWVVEADVVQEIPLENSASYSFWDGGIALVDDKIFIATTESISFGYAYFQTMRIVEVDAENFSVIDSYLITDEDGNFPDSFVFGGIVGNKMTGQVNGDQPFVYDFLGEWHEYKSFTVCSDYEASATGVGFIGDWAFGNLGDENKIFAKNLAAERPLGLIFNFDEGEMEDVSIFSVGPNALILRAGDTNFYTVNLSN
ncbi:MAG: hypothetical protein WA064_02690 [Candidatus Moraniibacteriota bacterium]